MINVGAETIMLDNLVPELEAQGYDVFVQPSREIIPRFLGSIRPDLIALRGDQNLIVEFLTPNKRSPERLKKIAELIEGQDRWQLKVMGIPLRQQRIDLAAPGDEQIADRLAEVARLMSAGFFDAAILLCWAGFEAMGRRLMPEELSRPQPPAQLVQTLASEGHVSPGEADVLRSFASMCSRITHGDLSVHARRQDIEALLHIVEPMLEPALSPGPNL